MKPLALHDLKPAGTPEGIRANVQSALARSLPELSPSLIAHDGTMVCVASGPSMPNFLDDIRQERERGRPIFAVKGAHDFLCEHGIEPDLYICIDPSPATHPAHKVERANDHTSYLIASRCDPSMFDVLKGRKIILMHAWAEQEHCPEYDHRLLIGGGPTSGLRAVTASYVMGFKKFVLYGYDSCLAADKTTKRFTGEVASKARVIDVIVDGRRFWSNAAMAQQAEHFQQYYNVMPGLTMDVKGDGLLAAIVHARRKRGLPA